MGLGSMDPEVYPMDLGSLDLEVCLVGRGSIDPEVCLVGLEGDTYGQVGPTFKLRMDVALECQALGPVPKRIE